MKSIYHLFLKKLAHFQVEYPVLTVVLLGMLTLAMYGGVSQVETVASLEQMMPKDVEEIKAFNELRDSHMGQDMIAVVLEVDKQSSDPNGVYDIRDKRVHDYLSYIRQRIQNQPDVLQTHAYTDLVNEQNYEESLKNPQLDKYINNDYTVTILLASTDVAADDPRMNLLSSKVKEIIDDAGHPPGVEIKFTGVPVIQQRLGELISADRTNTKWISTLLVFIITMIIFGTLTSALVPIIVVTVSVSWLYGTMGYTGLPISTLAGGVAAMVIGIGIDFAIHIMNKFKYERKKGMGVKHSVEQAVVDTGTALSATSVTTTAAFLSFLVGVMPEMGRFGILMSIGIAYSLLFSLFGLPALLILEERLIYWLRTKIHFGLESEFSLKKDDEVCRE